jgi:hypothetical protein|tara:strand:- start:185 stop:580 length:396 start_codon:yes stop_codon:yes gene_type:complete
MENSNKSKKFPISIRTILNNRILFRLVNIKNEKSESYKIFEEAKFNTTIRDLFLNSRYRTIDISYDTKANKRFKKLRLVIDNNNVTKENKNEILDIIKENKNFLLDKKNIVSNRKALEENIKYFEEKANSL